ncbi:hypothetical protein HK101_003394 [Irineochytrium annulatum]|nr:hypothetical protein HK101_003394 [Irineochytrium annulatum]
MDFAASRLAKLKEKRAGSGGPGARRANSLAVGADAGAAGIPADAGALKHSLTLPVDSADVSSTAASIATMTVSEPISEDAEDALTPLRQPHDSPSMTQSGTKRSVTIRAPTEGGRDDDDHPKFVSTTLPRKLGGTRKGNPLGRMGTLKNSEEKLLRRATTVKPPPPRVINNDEDLMAAILNGMEILVPAQDGSLDIIPRSGAGPLGGAGIGGDTLSRGPTRRITRIRTVSRVDEGSELATSRTVRRVVAARSPSPVRMKGARARSPLQPLSDPEDGDVPVILTPPEGDQPVADKDGAPLLGGKTIKGSANRTVRGRGGTVRARQSSPGATGTGVPEFLVDEDDEDMFFDTPEEEWIDDPSNPGVFARGTLRKRTTRRTTTTKVASRSPSPNNRFGNALTVPGTGTLSPLKDLSSDEEGGDVYLDSGKLSPTFRPKQSVMRRGVGGTLNRRRTAIKEIMVQDEHGVVSQVTVEEEEDDEFLDAEGGEWDEVDDEGNPVMREYSSEDGDGGMTARKKFKKGVGRVMHGVQISRSFYEILASRAGEVISHAGNAAQVLSTPAALLAGPAVAGLLNTGGAAAVAAGKAAVKQFGRKGTRTRVAAAEAALSKLTAAKLLERATASLGGDMADNTHVKALSQGLAAAIEGGQNDKALNFV